MEGSTREVLFDATYVCTAGRRADIHIFVFGNTDGNPESCQGDLCPSRHVIFFFVLPPCSKSVGRVLQAHETALSAENDGH